MAVSKASRVSENRATSEGKTSIDSFVGYNLKRVYMLIQSDFRAALGEEGLSTRTFSTLALVVDMPGITQSDLARMLGIERSGLVAIVDELEAREYLKRVPVPGDRRVQALEPTPQGKSDFAVMMAKIEKHERKVLSALTDAERDTLQKLLSKIRENGES